MPITSRHQINLQPKEREEIAALLSELERRGLTKEAQQLQKKLVNAQMFHTDENGYFVRMDGKKFNPNNEGQSNFIASSGRFVAFIGPRGSGKALDINTPILTTHGFEFLKNIQVGDVVFDSGGFPTSVISVSPVMCGHICYEVKFSDGSKIIADEDHLWAIKSKYDEFAFSRILTTKELANKKLKIGNNYYYGIDNCKPVEFPTKDLPIPPYILGVWLGDGNKREAKITISDLDQEILDKIKYLGFPVHNVVGKFSRSLGNYDGHNVDLQSKLGRLGLLGNKHIPNIYLLGDVEQRLELLRGLMDTDGTISKKGHCSFDCSDKRLVFCVYQLICSLGIKVTLRTFHSSCDGEKFKYYKLAFTSPLPVFSLSRKLARQKTYPRPDIYRRSIVSVTPTKSVPVKCIRVDTASRLFLAGYSCVPTHNSAVGAQKALRKIKEGQSGAVLNPDF